MTGKANTPELETGRLILRRFSEFDIDAIYSIFGDERANRFLPWFPIKSRGEAEDFFQRRYLRHMKTRRGIITLSALNLTIFLWDM